MRPPPPGFSSRSNLPADADLASAKRIADVMRLRLTRSFVEQQIGAPSFEEAVTQWKRGAPNKEFTRAYYRLPLLDLIVVYDEGQVVAYGITSLSEFFTPCVDGSEVCVGRV